MAEGFSLKRALAVLGCCVLLGVPALLEVRQLELRTDFADLLPEGQPSVRDLHELLRRVGGVSTLYVAIEGPPEPSGAFAERLAAAAQRDLADELVYVDHSVRAVRDFYERQALLYLSLDDLKAIDRALDRAHQRLNPLVASLDDDDGDAALASRLRELRQRAAPKRFPQGYYSSPDGQLTVVMLRPQGSSTGVDGARALLARTRHLVAGLHPEQQGLRVSLAGTTATSVEEYDTLRRDIVGTAALCALLVCLAVWLFLRRLRIVLLLAVPLGFGALYAFAAARLVVGYVNAQTAFLGALIVGTGVNYGVILCARYLEELGRGAPPQLALSSATRSTFRPTLTAAVATAVSFAALGVAQIRSFSQFGFIGSMGIMFCWGLSYTLLPALLIISQRIWPLRPPRATDRSWRQGLGYPRALARLAVARPRLVVGVAAVLSVAAVVVFVRFLPHALEYDLRNLRNRSSEASATALLGKRISRLLGQSLTPAIVAARDRDQARRLCGVLNERVALEGRQAPLKECVSIWSLLPKQQDEKLTLVARLRAKAERLPRGKLDAEGTEALDYLLAHVDLRRLGPDDLPDELSRRFLERDGRRGALVLVYPPAGRDLWVQENLFAFTDMLRSIDLGEGERVTSSGEAVVFADILRAIEEDAPRSTLVAALLVLLALATALGRGRGVLQVAATLVCGILMMVGIAALLGVKYNFFNYVALPTTFGIGLDYAVNIHQRARLEHPDRQGIERALLGTGPAVVLASLTTIIGYGVLLLADNRALASFGALAVLGEVTTLVAAMGLLPAALRVWPPRPARAASSAPGPHTADEAME